MVTYTINRITFLIICFFAFCFAELTHEEIEKAYYDSYALEKKQDYAGAMRPLHPVLEAYENGYTVNFRMGWLSHLNGNYADALRYYKRALAIFPASIEVLNCVSLTYMAKQDWSKVEEENYKILKIDYFNQKANYWYAYALKMQKKYGLAEKVCRKMLVIFPTSVFFLQELAENLYFKKKYKESKAIFLSVKILDPYNEIAKKYLDMLFEKK